MTYELDNGSFADETDSRNFELECRKIAFRDIDSAEFYRKTTSLSVIVHELYAYGSVYLLRPKSNQVNLKNAPASFTAWQRSHRMAGMSIR